MRLKNRIRIFLKSRFSMRRTTCRMWKRCRNPNSMFGVKWTRTIGSFPCSVTAGRDCSNSWSNCLHGKTNWNRIRRNFRKLPKKQSVGCYHAPFDASEGTAFHKLCGACGTELLQYANTLLGDSYGTLTLDHDLNIVLEMTVLFTAWNTSAPVLSIA